MNRQRVDDLHGVNGAHGQGEAGARCTALTKTLGPDGRPGRCRKPAWTPPGGPDGGPPLCHLHHPRAFETATRCSALTRQGRRCRNRSANRAAQEEGAPPLCAMHVRPESARPDFPRRCGARRQDGRPCHGWAVRGSDPPRCAVHVGSMQPRKGDPGRCRAFTKKGTRCRRWATVVSRRQGKPRCHMHGGDVASPRPPSGRRCSATGKDGRPCRQWAMHDSNPPLCVTHAGRAHGRRPTEADDEAGRACTATTLDGARCRNWAIPRTNPPRCFSHAYPDLHSSIRHGFYRRTPQFSKAWYAYIAELGEQGDPLGAELMLLRLKLREVLSYLDPAAELPPGAFLAAAALLDRGLRKSMRLVEAREKLRAAGQLP